MIPSPVVWGLLLGLGSSLHCAGMCGPLGCSLLIVPGGKGRAADLAIRLATMQLGRILSYVLLGMLFGIFGAGLQARLVPTTVHAGMQWAAATAVIWLGLATAGVVPSFAMADRIGAPIAHGLARARLALSQGGPEVSLAAGMVWGATPCAMVYSALFNSLLTGSAADGTALMLAFGIGTVPAVAASTMALVLAKSRQKRPGRIVAGMMLVVAGCLALLLTVPGSPLCISS